MSAVLLNSGTKIKINKKSAQPHVKETVIKARMQSQSEIKSISETSRTEERNDEEAREERRATGRSVAIVIFLSLMCLAIYHVFDRKTTILASVGSNLILTTENENNFIIIIFCLDFGASNHFIWIHILRYSHQQSG